MAILLALFISAVSVHAELKVNGLFTNHMVLQRDQAVPVWGKAEPGAAITVEFAGQKKTVKASDSGEWQAVLDSMPASPQPRGLIVRSSIGNQQLEISNVLVGDVWFCSGQSNMGWSLKLSANGETAIANANHPLIRLYKPIGAWSKTPTERIDGQWTECTSETVVNFSAVAYYFGRKLQEELNVPIGLLVSAFGGTKIEVWIPPSGYEGFDSLADIAGKVNNYPDGFGTNWKDRATKSVEAQWPCIRYNAMIHAHIPFAIKGAIWYQGESNMEDGMLYVDKTAALLQGWRGLWGYDFPFYFIQIAPYHYGVTDPSILPEFWEAQAEIVKRMPETGMAVISDAGEINNIHPSNKEVPGTRLALLALDNTYGKDVVSTGPTFRNMEIKGDTIEVTFDSADGMTTRDGREPDWFEIAGENGDFKPADAVINGDRIILSSQEIRNPVAMRFAWHKLAAPNLINAAGLPASAFRAGLFKDS